MPNIANILKSEIARVSRKEIKSAVEPVRKAAAKLRSDVAELKRQIAVLEKDNKRLRDVIAKGEGSSSQPAVDPAGESSKGWISGKGVRSLRKRLKLSQADFGKLAGVSANTVTNWEGKPGMLKLREPARDALLALRGIGIKEARRRLEA